MPKYKCEWWFLTRRLKDERERSGWFRKQRCHRAAGS